MPRTFEGFMLAKTLDLYQLFDLGTPHPRQLAETAWLIQDAIDDLKNMPPYQDRKKFSGRSAITIDGNKLKAEIHA